MNALELLLHIAKHLGVIDQDLPDDVNRIDLLDLRSRGLATWEEQSGICKKSAFVSKPIGKSSKNWKQYQWLAFFEVITRHEA
jgi:hypothetical protein